MQDKLFSSLFLFLLLLSLSFPFPEFIIKQKEFEDLKSELKIRFDSYFLVKGLNSQKSEAFVFFNDETKQVYLVVNGRKKLVNQEFLQKEDKSFIYLSRGVFFDGKYIYIYSSIKYGKPKYVVLFRVDPDVFNVKYYLFKNPPQALKVKLFADGKGNVLLTWQDEDKLPYRMVWVYSEDYMETYTSPSILSWKYGISLFEPVILNGKPYIIYFKKNKLLIRDLLKGKDKEIDTLFNPVVLKVKIKNKSIWIAVKDGKKLLKVYKLSNFKVKKNYTIDKLKVKGKIYDLEEFIWSFYDFEVVNEKPICVITAKFKSLPGVKINHLSLPDKYNIFVNSNNNTFSLVNETIPFLMYYTFPSIASDGNSWVISYFGRKFIHGNVFLSYKKQKKKSDIAVEPPSEETGFPKITNIGKRLYRLLYPIRKENSVYLKLVDIRVDKLRHYYNLPPRDILEKKLRERIEKFIKCQVDDDLECITNMADPVSRKMLKNLKKIHLDVLSYKCNEIMLIENSPLAICEGEIKHRIPKGTFIGLDKNVIRKIKTTDLWAYINGEWYYVPPAPFVRYFLKW